MHQINIKIFEASELQDVQWYMQKFPAKKYEVHIDPFDYELQKPSTVFWNYCMAAFAGQFLSESNDSIVVYKPTPEKLEGFRFEVEVPDLTSFGTSIYYFAKAYSMNSKYTTGFKRGAVNLFNGVYEYPVHPDCRLLADMAKEYAGPEEVNYNPPEMD